MDERTARISVPGVLETETKPIRNPVSAAPHRIQVVMPEGFEHRKAEIASARTESTAGIKFSIPPGVNRRGVKVDGDGSANPGARPPP